MYVLVTYKDEENQMKNEGKIPFKMRKIIFFQKKYIYMCAYPFTQNSWKHTYFFIWSNHHQFPMT